MNNRDYGQRARATHTVPGGQVECLPGAVLPSFRSDSGEWTPKYPIEVRRERSTGVHLFHSRRRRRRWRPGGRKGRAKDNSTHPWRVGKTAMGLLWLAAEAETVVVVYRDDSDNTGEDNTTIIWKRRRGKLGRVEAATTTHARDWFIDR